jgi:hypothetical protein
MIGYKLTDQNMRTRNNVQWKLGIERTVRGSFKKQQLCTPYWLHFYVEPRLAIIMNPIGANFKSPRLFKCNVGGKIQHENKGRLKSGCTKLTLIEELTLPVISNNQKVAFGILSSLKVCRDPDFVFWANNWINNIDRSYTTNAAAYTAASHATYADAAATASAYAAAAYAAYDAHAAHADAADAAHAAHAAAAFYATYATTTGSSFNHKDILILLDQALKIT